MYKLLGKRFIDLFLALLILVFLCPILIVAIICLLIQNKGKAFFIQERPGKNLKLFSIYKLKTMNDDKDSNGLLLPDNLRISSTGKLIRKFSIDELPQLFNVIKGEMSIIGPRPLLPQYIPLYNEFQLRRHEVLPGITGWSQVNGRNTIEWVQKFEFDVWYVDNLSFSLDLKIIFLTIKKVLKSEGVNSSNIITMEPFKGN